MRIVPFAIHHAGRTYVDGVDLSPAGFYALQAGPPPLPTTSAPQPGAFLDAFRSAHQTTDHVVCLTVSASLSAAHGAAGAAIAQAREELPGLTVNLIDTRTAGAAVGLVALKAARLAAEGASANRVLAAAERCAASVCFFGYLETLHYLWKGGRIPRAALWMGNLLGVKPLLELSAGRVGMIGRPRSRARAIARMTALVRQWLNGAPCRLAVVHGGAPEPGAMLAEHLERELRPVELIMGEFTPVIGAHTGPGLVACAAHPVED